MIKVNGNLIEVNKFPNNESLIDISPFLLKDLNEVFMKFESDSDLIALTFIANHITSQRKEFNLTIPYFPYSRMDRNENNRVFTLKSTTNLINNLGSKKITISEPHSDVVTALLDNVVVQETSIMLTRKLLREVYRDDTFIVYPDNGASKRYGKAFSNLDIVECSKERDFETGRIKKLNMNFYKNKNKRTTSMKKAIIIDDLCSKGGTFALTTEKLKENFPELEEVYLVIAHCEDNIHNGKLLENDLIKKVITTDSILSKEHAKITAYNIERMLQTGEIDDE